MAHRLESEVVDIDGNSAFGTVLTLGVPRVGEYIEVMMPGSDEFREFRVVKVSWVALGEQGYNGPKLYVEVE